MATTPALYEASSSFWGKISAMLQKMLNSSPTVIKGAISILFLILLFNAVYDLVRYSLVIEPFQVPNRFAEQQGYSGAILARRLGDEVKQITREIETPTLQEQVEKPSWFEQYRGLLPSSKQVMVRQYSDLKQSHKIDVTGFGVSLDVIVGYVLSILGIEQNRIYGEIIPKNDKFSLILRITGKPVKVFDNYQKVGDAIQDAAKHVLTILDPLPIGLYYCTNQENEKLRILVNDLQKVPPQTYEEKATIYTLLGCLLKNQKDYKTALHSLDSAQILTPNDPTIYIVKGDVLRKSGNYQAAIDNYQIVLGLQPDNYTVCSSLAKTWMQLDQPERAFSAYQQHAALLELDTLERYDDAWFYVDWANALLEVGRKDKYQKAYDKFAKAVEANPGFYLAYAFWGNALYEQKKHEAAAEKYQQAANLNPDIAWAYANWGNTLFSQKAYNQAHEKYTQATRLNSNFDWVYANWGDALIKLKKYGLASEKYQQAVEQGYHPSWVYGNWGYALQKQGRYEDAFDVYQQAYEQDKGLAAWIYKDWWRATENIDNLKKKLYFYQNYYVERKPDDAIFFANWAEVVRQQTPPQYQKAVELYQTAKQLREKAGEKLERWVYGNWAFVLRQINKYDQAFAVYKQAIKVYPDSQLLLDNWREALAEAEDPDEIFYFYNGRAAKTPTDCILLGNAWLQRDKPLTAIGYYKQAKEWEAEQASLSEKGLKNLNFYKNWLEATKILKQKADLKTFYPHELQIWAETAFKANFIVQEEYASLTTTSSGNGGQ